MEFGIWLSSAWKKKVCVSKTCEHLAELYESAVWIMFGRRLKEGGRKLFCATAKADSKASLNERIDSILENGRTYEVTSLCCKL